METFSEALCRQNTKNIHLAVRLVGLGQGYRGSAYPVPGIIHTREHRNTLLACIGLLQQIDRLPQNGREYQDTTPATCPFGTCEKSIAVTRAAEYHESVVVVKCACLVSEGMNVDVALGQELACTAIDHRLSSRRFPVLLNAESIRLRRTRM